MNRLAAFSLGLFFVFAGCSGGGNLSPATSSPAGSGGAQVEPFQVPIVSDPAVDGAARATRTAQNSYGGVPGIVRLIVPPPILQVTATPTPAPLDALRQTAAGTRLPLNSYGGVPAQATIIDAPGFPAGSQVNIAIVEVDAMAGGVAYPIVQFAAPTVINVLTYQSQALLLGTNTIPAIAYDGVQYVIDPALSSVVVGGTSYPMVFGTFANRTFMPATTGLTALYFYAPVNAAVTNPSFAVDFNTAEWISLRNGIAEVGPQWGGTVWSQSAVIDGTVVNAAGGPVSGATVAAYGAGGVLVEATQTGPTGAFELHALYGGSYSLTVYNTYAPATSDRTVTATGNDSVGASVTGPSFTVPAGYRITLGAIAD